MSKSADISYSVLGFSMGFIGLPLYVYLPKYYTEAFSVSLVMLSLLLLASRFVDMIQDPLIAWFSDWLGKKGVSRVTIISWSLPVLALSFLALLFPQTFIPVEVWLVGFLVITYSVYSFVSINYYTTASEIYEDYNQQTVLVSYREGLALIGVSVGSILPSTLLNITTVTVTHWVTWISYTVAAFSGLYLLRTKSPPIQFKTSASEKFFDSVLSVMGNKPYLYLALIFLLSNIAASLPATLVLFYIADVLKGQQYYGLFLMIYFIAALSGIPFWSKVSEKTSKGQAWMVGMIFTIIGFIWAAFLGPYDFVSYGIVCVITGFCLGTDLTMPTSMLSDVIKSTTNKAKYFGVWGFLGKSSIAVAGSLGLFVLGVLGYKPGQDITAQTSMYVAFTYALIPCIIKIIALIVLYKAPIDQKMVK